jgi:hypothetical protein
VKQYIVPDESSQWESYYQAESVLSDRDSAAKNFNPFAT